MNFFSRLTILLVILVAGSSLWAGTKPFSITFKEDLRFGVEEEDPEYTWLDAQLACFFDVDSRGHIFVVDQRTATIQEFDAKGMHVRTLGGKGQGPGEYQAVTIFSVLADDSAIALDFMQGSFKGNYYDRGVVFRESALLREMTGFMFKGHFNQNLGLVELIRAGGNKWNMHMDLVDHQGHVIKNIRTVPWPMQDMGRAGEAQAWVEYMGDQFKGFWQISDSGVGFLEDGRVVIANAAKGSYEIWAADASKLLNTVNVVPNAWPFTDTDKDGLVESISTILFKQAGPALQNIVTPAVLRKAIAHAQLPDVQNQIYDVIGMEGDLFAVVNRVNYGTGELEMDVIDAKKGRLAHVKMPGRGIFNVFGTRLVFKNGYAYAMTWNDDDENQMVRYTYNLSGGGTGR